MLFISLGLNISRASTRLDRTRVKRRWEAEGDHTAHETGAESRVKLSLPSVIPRRMWNLRKYNIGVGIIHSFMMVLIINH